MRDHFGKSIAVDRRRALACLAFVVAFAAGCSADTSITDAATPAEVAIGTPQGSYALSNIDNVNLYTGSVNIDVPLLQVGGRGNAGYTISLPMERRWSISAHSAPYQQIAYVLHTDKTPGLHYWYDSAGVPRFTPGFLVSREASPPDNQTASCGDGIARLMGPLLTRFSFIEEDGTEHELIDTKTTGLPMTPTDPVCQLNASTGGPDRGTTFRSHDGTGLLFVSDEEIHDKLFAFSNSPYVGVGTGWLYFADGRRYRFDQGRVSSTFDRNGNRTTFAYSGTGLTIVDPMGRSINVTYADFNTTFMDTIAYSGIAGAQRSIQLAYTQLQNVLAPGQTIQSTAQLFPTVVNLNGSSSVNPYVVQSITLADRSSYQFLYNSYAEVVRMTLPTSGAVEYDYPSSTDACSSGYFCVYADPSGETSWLYRRVMQRRELANGATTARKTLFASAYGSGTTVTVTEEDGSGTVIEAVKHHFFGNFASPGFAGQPGYNSTLADKEDLAQIYGGDGRLLSQTASTWAVRPCSATENCSSETGRPVSGVELDVRLMSETTTMDGLVKQVAYQYDQFNNVTDRSEYDWGQGGPGELLRHTATWYVTAPGYVDAPAHLLRLPSQVNVYAGASTLASLTYYRYDETPLTNDPGVVSHDGAFGTGYTARGNLTTKMEYVNLSNSYSVTKHTYDIAGNITSIIDPNGHSTTFSYNDTCNLYARPLTVTNALGQATTLGYDYGTDCSNGTGNLTFAIDPNGVQTAYAYNDPLDRVTQIRRAAGGNASQESQTNYLYPNPTWSVEYQDQKSTHDGLIQRQSVYDGFGRLVENRTIEDGAHYIATDTAYDALGRVAATYNPSRMTNGQSDGLGYATVISYDALNRPVSVKTADGSTR